MKSIAQLTHYLGLMLEQKSLAASPVLALTLDSREVQPQYGFLALKGERMHGLDFLEEVCQKFEQRPALILMDCDPDSSHIAVLERYPKVVWYVVDTLSERLAELANWFYDYPSQHIKVVGITGTNGKTSTAFYTAQLLQGLGASVALMGTLGNGVFKPGELEGLSYTRNTTPDVLSVQRHLASFVAQGVEWVVMEVSSHALALGRISGVQFECVALTQVTRDHLDFHGSVAAYQQEKQKLFTDYKANHKVINGKDSVGQSIVKQVNKHCVWEYAVTEIMPKKVGEAPQLQCHIMDQSLEGLLLQYFVSGLERKAAGIFEPVRVPLIGAFNAENIACALSIVLASLFREKLDKQWEALWLDLALTLAKMNAVPGRMQPVALPPGLPGVIIDFAHTPDALKQVLMAVKQYLPVTSKRKLWVVFGCGGDRDRGKRALMAEVAETCADRVMVTSDNPRFEQPEQIVSQIMEGFKYPENILTEVDREQAIRQVLTLAAPQDIVLIAGKGHETYQEIQGTQYFFKDENVVLAWATSFLHG